LALRAKSLISSEQPPAIGLGDPGASVANRQAELGRRHVGLDANADAPSAAVTDGVVEEGPQNLVQLIGVGETYDFEMVPQPSQKLWLEVRRGNGEWVLQAPVDAR